MRPCHKHPMKKWIPFLAAFLLYISIPSHLHAQWIPDGLIANPGELVSDWALVADEMGGAWILYTYDYNCKVQHIDADGYLQFGDNGLNVFEGLEHSGRCNGGIAGEMGCLLVVVQNDEISGNGQFYAQKLFANGERLWGPQGVPVSLPTETYQTTIDLVPRYVYPDGAGGLFSLFELGTNDLNMCGVNADGSLKFPDENIYIGTTFQGDPPGVLADGEGGVHIIWKELHSPTSLIMAGQHVLEDGTKEFPDNTFVMDGSLESGYGDPQVLFRDHSSNFYAQAGSALQRLDENFAPIWDPGGIDCRGNSYIATSSPMIILEDNSAAMVLAGLTGEIDHKLVLARYDSSGTNVFENDYVLFGNSTNRFSTTQLAFSLDQNSIYTVNFAFNDQHSGYRNYEVEHCDSSGTDLWPDRVVYLHSDFIYALRSHQCRGVATSDGHFIVGYINTDSHRIHLFKVTNDGYVLGRDEAVHENNIDGTPDTFILESAWPNPFNGQITFRLNVLHPGNYNLNIYAIDGRLITEQSLELVPGISQYIYHPDSMVSSGVYFVQVSLANKVLGTRKVVYLR